MAIIEKYVTVTGGGLHDGTSEADAWTYDEALANAVAGDRVNVKLGTHSCTTSSTTNGSVTDPIWVRGYVSTIGDLDALPLGTMVGATDIPMILGTGGNLGFRGTHINQSHLEYRGTTASTYVWEFNSSSRATSCRFTHASASNWAVCNFSDSAALDCYFNGSSASDLVKATRGTAISCTFEGSGLQKGTHFLRVINCVFKDLTTGWIPISWYGFVARGCTFINCTTGCDLSTYNTTSVISGCYFSGSTTAIKQSSGIGGAIVDSCCYHNVTTQLSGNIDSQSNESVDATDQFVNSAAGDYTLKATSNGYNAVKPNILAHLGTDTKIDVGAIQHVDAGGGVTNYNPFRNPVF